MRKINDEISADHLVSIRLPFKPVSVPVTESLQFDETQSRWVHATLVWLNDDQEWALFEFDKMTMNTLNAYALRNHGMQKLEILVSRHADGTVRLNAGFDSSVPVKELIGEAQFGVMEDLAGRLIERYRRISATTGSAQLKI
jgi:hypothetical protein